MGTNFSEILIGILTFSFKKMRLKVSSAKWWPFCLGLNVLTQWGQNKMGDIFSRHPNVVLEQKVWESIQPLFTMLIKIHYDIYHHYDLISDVHHPEYIRISIAVRRNMLLSMQTVGSVHNKNTRVSRYGDHAVCEVGHIVYKVFITASNYYECVFLAKVALLKIAGISRQFEGYEWCESVFNICELKS